MCKKATLKAIAADSKLSYREKEIIDSALEGNSVSASPSVGISVIALCATRRLECFVHRAMAFIATTVFVLALVCAVSLVHSCVAVRHTAGMAGSSNAGNVNNIGNVGGGTGSATFDPIIRVDGHTDINSNLSLPIP